MTGNDNADRPGDAGQERAGEEFGQDLHPAIDPREEPAVADEPLPSPPPLDVDERQGAFSDTDPSESIPLTAPASHDDSDASAGFTSRDTRPHEDAGDGLSGGTIAGDVSGPTILTSPPADATAGHDGPPSSQPEDPASGASANPDPAHPSETPPSSAKEASNGPGPIAGAAAAVSGAFSRLDPGRFFRSANGPSHEPGGADTADAPRVSPARVDGFRGFLDPRLHMPDLIPHRRFTAAAVAIAILMLMSNSAGLALIIFSSIVPVLIVMTITQQDVFEKESNLVVTALAIAGGVAGLLVGWLSSWIVSSQWFDTGRLNFGASGFGGRFAETAGTAPFMVWLFSALLLPAAAIAGMGAVPILLRRWPQFRNEVMDGMIMAGASAAGLSIGLNVVAWLPMIDGDGPQTAVGDWTLMIIGSTMLRPLIFTLCGAMIGAGVWRYMMSSSTFMAIFPAVAGVAGIFLLSIGSVQLQSNGIWPEFIWTVLVALSAFVFYRKVLDQAVTTDRQALGDQDQRMICPHCHQVTPVGAFCARCGQALRGIPDPADAADASAPGT